jgi:hypothetical protein
MKKPRQEKPQEIEKPLAGHRDKLLESAQRISDAMERVQASSFSQWLSSNAFRSIAPLARVNAVVIPKKGVQEPTAVPIARNVFRQDLQAGVWEISYDGISKSVKDAAGLKYIRVVLQSPGAKIPALQILGMCGYSGKQRAKDDYREDLHIGGGVKSDPVLDSRALRDCKNALDLLEEKIVTARQNGDSENIAIYTEKRDHLKHMMKTQTRPHRKSRQLGDEGEKARKTVSNAIDRAIKDIQVVHPKAASHLKKNIVKGMTFTYRNTNTTWQF